MDKAVILDAGEGKRLRPLTFVKPKCLLKLNRLTILEHQLINLIEFGVQEIILVIGYRADQIIRKIESLNFGLDVKFIYNPIYHKTNTVYSLWLAREYIREDFVYLNGDVVFHKEVLGRLLKSNHDTCIGVQRKRVSDEEVKVRLVSNVVKAIGKNMDLLGAHEEFIGIARFSKSFNKLFIGKLDEVVKEGKVDEFFEVALDRVLGDFDVYALDVSDLPCTEVDTYEDFNVAKNFYSKIVKGY